jgi:hypothetical protein
MNSSTIPHATDPGHVDADASALHYMEYAYVQMEDGKSPAGFAGKTIAHAFEDCSDALHALVATMLADVDAYLATYTPKPDTEYHSEAASIRMYRNHERAAYARTLRTRKANA